MQISFLTTSFGSVIVPESTPGELSELDSVTVGELLNSRGVLLFRGFQASLDSFETFTQRFASSFLRHGNPQRLRAPGDGFTVSVTPGGERIDLHSEFAYSPYRPELIWFYCTTPAAIGGETLLCDGCNLFSMLRPSLQQEFRLRKVRYIYRDMANWSRFLLVQENGLPLTAGEPGTAWKLDGNGSLCEFTYTTSALTNTSTGCFAFACSLLDWGYSFEEAVFEDGTEIKADYISDIRALAWTTSLHVRLAENDLLMIDNQRFMHGREAYRDSGRRLFLRMGRRLSSSLAP